MNWAIPLLPLIRGVNMGKFTFYMSYNIWTQRRICTSNK